VALRIYTPLLKIINCIRWSDRSDITATFCAWISQRRMGVGVQRHSFLISTLDRVSDQLHGPGCFITDGAQWHPMNRGWVGPTARLDVVNRKICCPCRESKYDSSTAHHENQSSYKLLKYFGNQKKY
jgi:hypothetical protein